MRLSNSTEFRFDNSLVEGRGRHFVSRFIEAGLVSYEKAGVLKVSKETLDKFVQSLVGCPVIIRHQIVKNENVDEIRCGVVSGVSYNSADGWFWCEGIIWDAEAIKKIEQGWSVSCTYTVTESTGESGEWHNMSFDDELLNGVFEHLAIVPNPRYEEATILLNSKEEKSDMLLKLFNSKKIRNSNEGKDMKKENEDSIDKNALKNRIMEHVNKAVKGQGEIDGESEEKWYKDFREMLDKLAYSESEDDKSNEKEDEETEEKEEEKKENSCKPNESDKDEEGKEEEDDKENEDEEDDDKEENRKSNSKGGFDKIKKLSNSASVEVVSGYMSESARIELGKSLY